jgi:hypothetical protein
VQFILQANTFILELTDCRLHQCCGHEGMLSLAMEIPVSFLPEGSAN